MVRSYTKKRKVAPSAMSATPAKNAIAIKALARRVAANTAEIQHYRPSTYFLTNAANNLVQEQRIDVTQDLWAAALTGPGATFNRITGNQFKHKSITVKVQLTQGTCIRIALVVPKRAGHVATFGLNFCTQLDPEQYWIVDDRSFKGYAGQWGAGNDKHDTSLKTYTVGLRNLISQIETSDTPVQIEKGNLQMLVMYENSAALASSNNDYCGKLSYMVAFQDN